MLARVNACGVSGVKGFPVQVEVDISGSMPIFEIVGLPDTSVKESRERVRAAIQNSGFAFPYTRVVVNLAPASEKKQGPVFDLPIAVSVLCASGIVPNPACEKIAILGELALDGSVRGVHGMLPMVLAARELGLASVLLPAENAAEVSYVTGIDLYAIHSLREVVAHLRGKAAEPVPQRDFEAEARPDPDVDFADIRGLSGPKRALEIAAAGGHNLLLIGAPGGGKTMLARSLPGILPDMTLEEALEVTRIYSVSGETDPKTGIVRTRPFRAPHHSASAAALVGGGQSAMPGEISKAHNGVLFLDELAEFRREALDMLRQPLEDGVIDLVRVKAQTRYPSRAMLVCAMNPCPCGFYGAPGDRCRCTQPMVASHLSRVSGPLLDRIDLHVEVESVPVEELTRPTAKEEPSCDVRDRVNAARERQLRRFQRDGIYCNAQIGSRRIHEVCALPTQVQRTLAMATERYGYTSRAVTRLLRIARTIADLADAAGIENDHLLEAVQYRALDRKYWGRSYA